MPTIFYGVAGEGNGHAIRSKTIIDDLKKEYTVHIFSYGKGYRYLKEFFPVKRILGFHMYYLNNTVSSFLTGIVNTVKFPLMCIASLQYLLAFLKHKPDVVITDFEPFVFYWAKMFQATTISIGNQHSITNTKIDKIRDQWIIELYSHIVIKSFLPNPTHTIISTFFPAKIIKKNTILVPPVIRKEVQEIKKQKIRHNDNIFVYQTSSSYKNMLSVLKEIDREFVIYGFDKEEKDGNLHFKKFNKEEHLVDLATADAVIINGGFTALSEALFLQKPIFSIPIKRQFEQIINGHYLNKLQYGMAVKDITKENLKEFLRKKEEYRKKMKKIKWEGNRLLFGVLQRVIEENVK